MRLNQKGRLAQKTQISLKSFLLAAGLLVAAIAAFVLLRPQLAVEEVCDNGLDDDSDGLIDQLDPDCPGYSGFTQLRRIAILGSKVNGESDLLHFPVLFQRTDPDFRHTSFGGRMEHLSGYDVEFRLMDGTLLDVDLQRYDPATGELIAWIKIPALSPANDTPIKMLFGNRSVASSPSSTRTWSSDYAARWHMDNNPGSSSPQLRDVSPSGAHASSNGGMTAADLRTGKIGYATWFDGSNDFYQLQTPVLAAERFTLSAWVASAQNTGHWHGFLGNQPSGVNDRSPSLWVYGNTNGFTGIHGGFGNGSDWGAAWASPGGLISNDGVTWSLVTYTYDGVLSRLYINGREVFTHDPGGRVPFASPIRWIGRVDNNFRGLLDEISVVRVARSADWIATEYANQSDPEGFYTFGEASAFPVEWMGFEASLRQSDAVLQWTTAREQNADVFAVERSADGIAFEEIGRVNARGNSDIPTDYAFTDRDVARNGLQRVYYRLRQVDTDGKTDFSSRVELALKQEAKLTLSVYPNPATDLVTIEPSGGEAMRITVISVNGQVMASFDPSEVAASGRVEINAADWAPGIYLVSAESGRKMVQEKLIVR